MSARSWGKSSEPRSTRSAADLAAKLASGEVSSVEATQAHLDRIAAVDGDVHAFLHVVDQDALTTAAAIDARRAGGRDSSPSSPVFRSPSRTCSARIDMPSTAGSKILEGWMSALRRHRRRATARGRPRSARQDQHGRVRHGLLDRALGLRSDPQPVGPRADPRRFRRRLGCRGRGLRGAARTRLGHGWKHPPARCRHRFGRRQAHLRRRLALRRDRARLLARPGRPGHAHGARRRAAARRHRRLRQARQHVAERRVAVVRRGRPRGRPAESLKGLRVGVVKELDGPGFQAGVSQRFHEALDAAAATPAPRSSRSVPRTSSTRSRPTT